MITRNNLQTHSEVGSNLSAEIQQKSYKQEDNSRSAYEHIRPCCKIDLHMQHNHVFSFEDFFLKETPKETKEITHKK